MPVATGTIAAGDGKFDITATNAFSEFGVDLSGYQTGDYILAAYNTATDYGIYGWISGTAPGGETLDAELLTNANLNAGDTGWYKEGGWTIIDQGGGNYAAVATNLEGNLGIYQTVAYVEGALYKSVTECIELTAGSFAILYGKGPYAMSDVFTTIGVKSFYVTNIAAFNGGLFPISYYSGRSVGDTLKLDNNSHKRLTDCAATGALIVSAHGGATRAWAYQHASFNPNAEMTYKVFYVGQP